MLRLLLALTIFVLPNALRFSIDTGIPGLNLTNLLFLLVCIGLALGGRDSTPMQRSRLSPALIGLIVVIVLGFLNAQMTDPGDFSEDVTRLKYLLFYPLLYWVYRRSHQDLKGTRQLIILTLAVAAIAGLEAIQQGLQWGLANYSPSKRARGPFGDLNAANRAGVFYALFLPMFVALVLFLRGRGFWRVAALGGCGILGLAIMVTYSRQAYLIGLIGIFLLLLRRNVLLSIALGAVMAASISLVPASVIQRVTGTTQQSTSMGPAEVDGSTASRLDIWKGALEMWRDHPGGVGLDRFPHHIGNYTNFPGMDAHNAFMLVFAECGPLGLAALLWVFWRLWALARHLLRSATTDPESVALALGFAIAVVSLALGNLFSTYIFEGSAMGNFWILCGLLERYAALKKQAVGENAAATSVPSPAGFERFPLLARIRPGYQRRG